MKLFALIFSLLLAQAIGLAHAGTLANGGWSPKNCGVKPDEPTIADDNVEAFNKSVAAINNWQQQAKVYFECLIKEANTDNAIIADTANKGQADYRKSVEAIGVAADAAKKKLDKQ